MILELHTNSRDGLYDAKAIYDDGIVTVQKGSYINLKYGEGFRPSPYIMGLLQDRELVTTEGILQKDISFNSLSTAATFVAGRISNGRITWRTPDGKYVRCALNEGK